MILFFIFSQRYYCFFIMLINVLNVLLDIYSGVIQDFNDFSSISPYVLCTYYTLLILPNFRILTWIRPLTYTYMLQEFKELCELSSQLHWLFTPSFSFEYIFWNLVTFKCVAQGSPLCTGQARNKKLVFGRHLWQTHYIVSTDNY